VVGHGHGRHVLLSARLHQITDPTGAVQKTVAGVKMEMDKLLGAHKRDGKDSAERMKDFFGFATIFVANSQIRPL